MSLNWRIYCQLYRQADYPAWGIFPHPSVSAIAKTLGIPRVTVWRRLAEMQRSGFLKGFEVIPNPSLFGVGLCAYIVNIPDSRSRIRFLDELEFVDGAFFAQRGLEQDVRVLAISDSPSSQLRREKMILRIAGVESLSLPLRVWLPGCTYEVPPDGWRFIQALRTNPEWSLSRLAKALEISARTASKRYRVLVRERAILGSCSEDFTKFPGVVVGTSLTLNERADEGSVVRAVNQLYPDALVVPNPLRPPGAHSTKHAILRETPNAAGAEDSLAAVLSIQGIARAETFFPGVVRAYRHWFDSRITEAIGRLEA